MRKRKLLIALLLVITIAALPSCMAMTPTEGAIVGGATGAAVGGLIGYVLGNPGLGAAIGGTVGAMSGAAQGAENQRQLLELHKEKTATLPEEWKNQGNLVVANDNIRYVVGEDYMVWDQAEGKFVYREWATLKDQARQYGVRVDNLPVDWHPDGKKDFGIKRRPDGTVYYNFGDDHMAWNQTEGKWETED